MGTPLDEARATVAKMETEQKLVDAMEKAAVVADKSPTPKNMAEHNRTQEALVDYRAQIYPGGTALGGDVTKDAD